MLEVNGVSKLNKTSPPDGGYGWIIVLACGVAIGFVSSVIKSAGLIYVAVLVDYPHTDRGMAVTMATAVRGVMFLVGIISVNLCHIYSYRCIVFIGGVVGGLGLILCALVNNVWLLILFFGGITGLGTGFVHAPCIGITACYFTKKRSTAVGLMLTLSGVIICMFPPMLQYFMDEYGLRGTLLIWGAILLNVCVSSLLLRQPKWEDEEELIQPNKKKTGFSSIVKLGHKLRNDRFLFKDPVFLLLLGNRVTFFFNNVAVPVIMPDFIQTEVSQHVNMAETAILVSLLAVGDLAARGVSGWLLDYFSRWRKHIYLIVLIATATSTLTFQWLTDWVILIACNCVLYGFLCGIDLILTYVLVFDVFPADGTGAHAIQQTVTGLCLFLQGPVIGGLWSINQNYGSSWNTLAFIVVISVIMWITQMPIFKKFRT